MSKYLAWNRITNNKHSEKAINDLYNEGYLFTRVDKGVMDQTRSLRIDLAHFTLSSENRRVLKKTDEVKLTKIALPLPDYHWSIGKLGKDFYTTKFGEGTFSANKIKELLTEPDKSNFNIAFVYEHKNLEKLGYTIALETDEIVHYCYPFYKLNTAIPNLGLGMMLKAIAWAKEQGKKYIYLGSFQRPTDTYKLQFEGLEWFDGQNWQVDLEKLKTTTHEK